MDNVPLAAKNGLQLNAELPRQRDRQRSVLIEKEALSRR